MPTNDLAEVIARLRELLDVAGNERWEVDPDHRPGMEYNNIICIEGDANLRVAFMAHDGPENQDRFDAKAALIAALRNAAPAILDAAEAGMRTHSVLLDCLGYVEEGWLKERIREALKEKPHD